MTEPRLLLDRMLAPAIAEQLRDRGHDVAAVTERPHLTGVADEADEQVLELAAGEARSVVTLNIVDFAALESVWNASNRSHAGIVYVATSTFPQNKGFIGALVKALDHAISAGRLPGRDSTWYLRPAPVAARRSSGLRTGPGLVADSCWFSDTCPPAAQAVERASPPAPSGAAGSPSPDGRADCAAGAPTS